MNNVDWGYLWALVAGVLLGVTVSTTMLKDMEQTVLSQQKFIDKHCDWRYNQ